MKDLSVTSSKDFNGGVQTFGNPDLWKLISKAWNKNEGWMKSTKGIQFETGVLIQVSTQQGDNVAEALQFVPGAKLTDLYGRKDPLFSDVQSSDEDEIEITY